MRFDRRNIIILTVASIALCAFLFTFIRGVSSFIHIFGNHPGVALTQQEIFDRHHDGNLTGQPVIPKILHQIYHNWKDTASTDIPEDWKAIRQTCLDQTAGWEHKLWGNDASRKFIAETYPDFLATYDGYPHPVQRVDALKYFLMLHYGGIYIDLDNGCLTPLEPLLYYPNWITDGGQGALSNNILGSVPGHPFYARVTASLHAWSWNYIVPYATVHYASGQWFITAVWNEYHAALSSIVGSEKGSEGDGEVVVDVEPLVRVMMDMRPGAAKWVFFDMGRGESWVEWDKYYFDIIGNRIVPALVRHWLLAGLGAIGIVAGSVWACARWKRRRRTAGKGYALVGHRDEAEEIEFEDRQTR